MGHKITGYMNACRKKRVLVIGAAGMLGHKLYQRYKERFEVWATVRSAFANYAKYDLFDRKSMVCDIDVCDLGKVAQVVTTVQPDVIINCVGIIKQLPTAKDPIAALKINSLFPHELANICKAANCRLIHISTDCVFSGKKGSYTEDDSSDATDLYGRSKLLGEIHQAGCLTLRTSIIGRELYTTSGLVEWFLSNKGGKVKGFKKAIYTGFTTPALSDIIANLIENYPDLSGLYHVSSEPIDKYSLLCLFRDAFGVKIEIGPEYEVQIDRSLDSSRFRSKTGFRPPKWEEMVRKMAEDPTPYDIWRNTKTK